MPWRPLPRIAFAVAIYPFQPSSPADLPLELGDELYIIEQGGVDGEWYRGYLVAPPSLLAGLTSVKGQTLEARVFSGIFPRNCVEIREVLGDSDGSRAPSNVDRLSALRVNGVDADQRSSSAFSQIGGDESVKGEVSSVVIARKGKPAQILIQKPDEDDATSRKSSSIGRWGGIPLTPVPISPRDPDAPKPPAPVPMLKIGDETPTSFSEPLVDEIASCLREWHSSKLHELLLARQYRVLEEMSSIVLELDLARRQLLHDVLTAKEKEALRREVVWKLVKSNKMLSNEVVVRDPDQRGRLLTGEDSAIQLTKLQSEMSTLDNPPTQPSDASVLHHLLLEINAVSGNSPGPVSLAMYLGHKVENGALAPLSETYILDIPSPEKFASMGQSAKLKTLFTELSVADIGDGSAGGPQLYLVVTILAPELAPASAAPLSRSSTSRDGSSSAKPPSTANASVKGNLKTRRSMMWAPKSRGFQGVDSVRETATVTPQSPTSSNSGKDALNSQLAAKESKLVRAVGVGVIEISLLVRQDKDTEQVINVWSPAEEGEQGESRPEDFDELIRVLLPSQTGRYARSHRAARLHVHLSPFVASDADTLVRSNPTILHDVVQTRRIGFAEAPSKPRSDIYITLSQAVFPPDALLSHPQAGQVAVPAAFDLRHIQLTLEVRDSSGARIERCIFPSSYNVAHTAWRTTIAARGTPWNQTIRLKIPTEQIPGSHLIMSVADAPEFPFALAWMPLMEQQAFIRDGRHSLLLHFYDKQTSSIENGKGAYLSLPWSALGRNESAKDEAVTGPLATLRLETHLCSTQYSQDQVLLTLLTWKERPLTQVLETLKRLAFVPEIEIAKQLSNVFDALFGILVENAGNEDLEDLVFRDVVTVLGLVHDRRFNLGPLVDYYTEEKFYFPFATQCLIRSYVRLLQAPNDAQQSRYLRAAFKVGKHILKFIINAREQQKAKEEGIGITNVQSTFNRDLHTVFKSFEALMRNPSPSLVGSKTLAVQHFHTWLPEVSQAIGKDEMIMIALSFMDSCNDVQGMLILYKLVLIQNYTQLDIFVEGPERRTLLSSCVGWLAPYWGSIGTVTDQYRDQVRLCCAVVSQFVKLPDPQLYEFMPKIVASYCAIVIEGVEETSYLSLLFSKTFPFQVKAFKTGQRFDEALVELAAVIAGIATVPDPKFPVLKELEVATFIAQALEAHNSILNCEAYPQSWLSMHIYNHRAAIKSLEHLSTALIDRFLPAPDDADSFDMKLWEAFFMTLLKVVSSDTLALETFPEQKRRAVWKIAGDVRDQGAELLRTTWEAIGWDATEEERERYGLQKLGGYQVQYVPGLIAPIIELCLSVHEGLRHVAVDVLRTMILSEWDLNQDVSIIEMEIISSLDGLFKTRHVNDSIIQKLFINELLELFEGYAAVDEDLTSAVKDLIATVDELLDLLVAAQSGPMTESLHTLKLMEYMKDMGREDIFIRYVHELADAQAAAGNFTEAGLALQFHADLYDWDVSKAVPTILNPALPEQTSFERKESLYFAIIQHFEDGKAWAHALLCYKELVGQYENAVMDFLKLSRAQSSMARIHESIAKEDKQFPRYFRVIYKGLGFQTSLRDKEFIFEGLPSERMASFVDRMQRENPTAQILSSGEEQDLEGQFLQISAVTVHRDLNHPVYQRSKIPQSVRDHLLISTPSQFSVTTKRKTHGADVKELCVEKIVFTTAEPFPNILRRSEIVAAEEIALSPLQTAIERTWRRTQELWLLEKRAAVGDDPGLSGLTDALQQLLDMGSASASCVALYRQFLTTDDTKDAEEGADELDEEDEADAPPKPIDPMENSLAVALIDHALAIKHALSLFSRPAHQATQGELLRRFEEAFGPEIESLALVAQDSSHPNSYQSPNSPDPRQTPTLSRPMSPEQELIRSSRNDAKGKHTHKQSVSQRISIINPFKRSNHGLSDSVATIQPPKGGQESPHINGFTTGHHSSPSNAGGETHGRDDDAATVHSRTTSQSRGIKSDTQQKRRSFFGGDKTHQKLGSTVSIPAGNGNGNAITDDAPKSHKTRGSRSGSRDASTTSRDGRSRSGSQRTGGPERDKPHQPKHGGWSTIPPPSDLQRPLTAQSSVHSLRDQADGNDGGSRQAAQDTSGSGNARESVFRRFSLLKGVGRKTSRLDFKSGGNRVGVMTVQEE